MKAPVDAGAFIGYGHRMMNEIKANDLAAPDAVQEIYRVAEEHFANGESYNLDTGLWTSHDNERSGRKTEIECTAGDSADRQDWTTLKAVGGVAPRLPGNVPLVDADPSPDGDPLRPGSLSSISERNTRALTG